MYSLFNVKSHQLQSTLRYSSFECQLLNMNIGGSSATDGATVAVIYRPPSTSLPTFYNEFSDLLDKVGDVSDSDRFIACGDVNCGGPDSSSIGDELSSVLEAHGLRQFVTAATRRTPTVSNLLDVVVAMESSCRITNVAVQPTHCVSDHDLVTWSWASRLRPQRRVLTYRFRNLKAVNWVKFRDDVRHSELFTSPVKSANDFADQLDNTITAVLDLHCPIQVRHKFAPTRRDSRWLNACAIEAKRTRRRLERRWKSSQREDDYVAYRKACRSANKSIINSRCDFYSQRIRAASSNPRLKWTAIRDVLHLCNKIDIRSSHDCRILADNFAAYFIDKIRKIKTAIKLRLGNSDADPLQSDQAFSGTAMSTLLPPSIDEVRKLINSMPAKSSPMDRIP